MLFCHVTSRISDDKHQELLQQKGGNGFPYLVIMDESGAVLAKVGNRSVAGFQAAVEQAQAIKTKLEAYAEKAAAGDSEAKLEMFKLNAQLGRFASIDEARKAASELGLDEDATRNLINENLGDMMIQQGLTGVSDRATAVKLCAEMAKQGVKPTRGPTQVFQTFWFLTAEYAQANKDLELMEKAFTELYAVLSAYPQARSVLTKMEETLKAMRAETGK